jgi:predicted dehydrogenase
MIHYLFGNIKQVDARGKSIYNKEVEDYVSANLNLINGILGSLEVSWSMENYRLPELYIEIHLDEGKITTTEKYIKIFSKKDSSSIKKGEICYYKQHLTKNIPINLGGPEYTLEDLHLLNCIKKNEKTLCDFHEAAKTNFVIDKIYNSIKNDAEEKIQYGVE